MNEKAAKPFALYGCEKMIYDVRMGPMAVCHKDIIYIAYQANPNGPEAHPHVITCDLQAGEWSKPMSKIQMMKALGLDGRRTFNKFAEQVGIRRVGSRQLWQMRLDTMDPRNRAKIEKA